eukprot:scaffold192220_cov28-Tisochrysis_lutea.AAC.4
MCAGSQAALHPGWIARHCRCWDAATCPRKAGRRWLRACWVTPRTGASASCMAACTRIEQRIGADPSTDLHVHPKGVAWREGDGRHHLCCCVYVRSTLC